MAVANSWTNAAFKARALVQQGTLSETPAWLEIMERSACFSLTVSAVANSSNHSLRILHRTGSGRLSRRKAKLPSRLSMTRTGCIKRTWQSIRRYAHSLKYALSQIRAVKHSNLRSGLSLEENTTCLALAVSATASRPQFRATARNEAVCHGTVCSDGAGVQPQNSIQDG